MATSPPPSVSISLASTRALTVRLLHLAGLSCHRSFLRLTASDALPPARVAAHHVLVKHSALPASRLHVLHIAHSQPVPAALPADVVTPQSQTVLSRASQPVDCPVTAALLPGWTDVDLCHDLLKTSLTALLSTLHFPAQEDRADVGRLRDQAAARCVEVEEGKSESTWEELIPPHLRCLPHHRSAAEYRRQVLERATGGMDETALHLMPQGLMVVLVVGNDSSAGGRLRIVDEGEEDEDGEQSGSHDGDLSTSLLSHPPEPPPRRLVLSYYRQGAEWPQPRPLTRYEAVILLSSPHRAQLHVEMLLDLTAGEAQALSGRWHGEDGVDESGAVAGGSMGRRSRRLAGEPVERVWAVDTPVDVMMRIQRHLFTNHPLEVPPALHTDIHNASPSDST
jgi:hypothetical protein